MAKQPDQDWTEIEYLRREVVRLNALAEKCADTEERLKRLASFPEENPNPVIEMNLDGRTEYLNPAAREQFPELAALGPEHPLLRESWQAFLDGTDNARSVVECEIRVGDSIYEQKICYAAETDRRHVRIYVHDITRRKRAEASNKKLLETLVRAHEEERHRVSRELHDEAGQALTALKLSLELIRNEIPRKLEEARRDLTDAIGLTDSTKEQIRLLARGLRPSALDTLGLNLTLESFCRDFSKRTQLPIDYSGVDVQELSDAANMCLYRALQEALTNVARHAGATCARVRLLRDPTPAKVRLVVEDDGRGPDEETAAGLARETDTSGIGLLGMQERLSLFRGELSIDRGELGGLRLSAELPTGEER